MFASCVAAQSHGTTALMNPGLSSDEGALFTSRPDVASETTGTFHGVPTEEDG